MQKAKTLSDIESALQAVRALEYNHEFYVDLNDLRNGYDENKILEALHIDTKNYTYNQDNPFNKSIVFVAGIGGSGKSTEISRWIHYLNNPQAFYCILCNIEHSLDLNNLEYSDIMIFQVKKLINHLIKDNIQLNTLVIELLQHVLNDIVYEIDGKYDISIQKTDGSKTLKNIYNLLQNLVHYLKNNLVQSRIVRNAIKHYFYQLVDCFNTFFEAVNRQLRQENKAQEICFILDGIEKVKSGEMRRKLIMDESFRLIQMRCNTLCILPVELKKEERELSLFSTVISLPLPSVEDRASHPIEKAYKRFIQLVSQRIDFKLFDKEETLRQAIAFSGGSPSELMDIISEASKIAIFQKKNINANAIDLAIRKLAADKSKFINETDINLLKKLKDLNKRGIPVTNDDGFEELIQRQVVFEYDHNSLKKVKPLIKASNLYRFHVG